MSATWTNLDCMVNVANVIHHLDFNINAIDLGAETDGDEFDVLDEGALPSNLRDPFKCAYVDIDGTPGE